jgi:hypothetical protein
MQTEALSKEDFDKVDKGIRLIKPKVVPRPEPKKPVVENEVKLSQIPEGYTVKLEQAFKKVLKNEEGMRFIGWEVLIELTPIPKEKGTPGRPFEPKTLMGWMIEGEFMALLRTYSKQIDRQVIRW